MAAYSARYEAALILAIRAHRAQLRKGSDIPYASHPIHVSVILLRLGFSEDLAIAGLLHDVVEDQDVSIDRIQEEFGPVVAALVSAVTEQKLEAGTKRPWRVRKEEALAHMREGSLDIATLKTADVLHNARSLAEQLRRAGAGTWRHFTRGAEDALWYYRSIAGVARDRLGPTPLVEELEQAIRDLEQTVAETGTA